MNFIPSYGYQPYTSSFNPNSAYDSLRGYGNSGINYTQPTEVFTDVTDRFLKDFLDLGTGNIDEVTRRLMSPVVNSFRPDYSTAPTDSLGTPLGTPPTAISTLTDVSSSRDIKLDIAGLENQLAYTQNFLNILTVGNLPALATLLTEKAGVPRQMADVFAKRIFENISGKYQLIISYFQTKINQIQSRIQGLQTQADLNDKQTQNNKQALDKTIQGFGTA